MAATSKDPLAQNKPGAIPSKKATPDAPGCMCCDEKSVSLRTAAAAGALRQDDLSTLLPALRIRRGQMFTANPAVHIFEHLTAQTFRVLDIVIHCRVVRINISRHNFGEEKSTPGHCF